MERDKQIRYRTEENVMKLLSLLVKIDKKTIKIIYQKLQY